jgi:hypothetical protein
MIPLAEIHLIKALFGTNLVFQQASGTEAQASNQWDQVDDFKWLKAEQSPHWSILAEESRVKDEVWRDVTAEGNVLRINEVLEAVRGR